MPQPYFVKGLIGKVLAYGGLQIRKYIPHGLQIHADKVIPTNIRLYFVFVLVLVFTGICNPRVI